MQVLDHVSITVVAIGDARRFYDAIMEALGVAKVYERADALGYGPRCSATSPLESFVAIYESAAATPDSRCHWAFKASSRQQVIAFHAAALANGGRDDGAPGLRPNYHADYFAAFVIDPSGNRLEAVCHRGV